MISINKASLHDVDFLARLGRQSYLAHFADIWHDKGLNYYLDYHFTEATLKKLIASADTEYYFVSEDNHEPVGFCKINYNKPLPFGDTEAGIEIEKLYLLPSSTGKGYGTALLQYVFAIALNKNIPFLWLDVLKSNTDAIKMYERNGFQIAGEIPFSTDKMKIGMWVMRRWVTKKYEDAGRHPHI